jgi:NarL family two-component system response regulator LiaR
VVRARVNNRNGKSPDPQGFHTLIVEPREVAAAGLERVLQRNGIPVTGIAEDGGQALSLVRTTRPAVILIDLDLPDMSGVQAGKRILRQSPWVTVMAITRGKDDPAVRRALLAGFDGHVDLDAPGSEVAGSIRRSPERPGPVFAHIAPPEEPQEDGWVPSGHLTDREREVLRLLAVGLRNDRIAEMLFLSPHTVRTHVQNIRTKLGVRSRLEAAVFAIKHGLAEGGGEARTA